ncbi:MAG: hypothetical protein PHD72_00575 [Patescibacteria group bacterium]|nr:hypothetical protein [Patescibacteria group bacterium]
MFFKKHLVAVIISGTALVIFIFVFAVAIVQMQQARAAMRTALANLDKIAEEHRYLLAGIEYGKSSTTTVDSDKEIRERITKEMSLENVRYGRLPSDIFAHASWYYPPITDFPMATSVYVDLPTNSWYEDLEGKHHVTYKAVSDYLPVKFIDPENNLRPVAQSSDLFSGNDSQGEAEFNKIGDFEYGGKSGFVFWARSYVGEGEMGGVSEGKLRYFVQYDDKIFFLQKNSDPLTADDGLIKSAFAVDKYLAIPNNVRTPKYIYKTDDQRLVFVEFFKSPMGDMSLSTPTTSPMTFATAGFKVWHAASAPGRGEEEEENSFVVFNDGSYAEYRAEKLEDFSSRVTIGTAKFPLSEYAPYRKGGCGSDVYNVIKGLDKGSLTLIGKAGNGDPLYQYSDSEKIKPMYDLSFYPAENTERLSFEGFLKDQPYFIWFNKFGLALQYQKTKYAPVAECGKPVIYLYPEKDMSVSVKVEPNGGFKFTEPTYNNGWNVWATTQSKLTNISDGVSYPYLFWEGKAYNYDTPDHGFVLKRENVARDMATLLKRLGLNEKESADFMEFWQPKLEVKPYVYVTFLAQEKFDELAPLTVTPQPDKVIRVFMDYEPLDQFVSVPPLKITTPTRTGFTVVEWGGRLR